MSYNSTLQTNNSSLEEIITQLNNMPDAGGTDTSDATASASDILSGKTAYVKGEKVTGNIATVTQATPAVTINTANGLITATATQTAGYVAAGTKSGTKQLTFKAATTITPGTTNQTAVAANTYVGGAITVKGDANLVASNIVSGKSIFGVVGTATTGGGGDPFDTSPFTYTVNSVSGAQYGFALNTNGYYESQNKGKNSTYAICRVNLVVKTACNITFDVINYAESNFDYALFSNLDTTLTLSNGADSSNVKKNFKGLQSANVVNVIYENVSVGNHTIDIKFIKDSSQHSNNDSVQFKIQEQGGLSQETIDKILAADTDLVAENIKSGVDIFGVIGTYAGGGGGDTSIEDAFVTRTLTTYTNDRVTSIGKGVFGDYTSLISVSFPACTSIGNYAFSGCTKLTNVSFPKATSMGYYAFYGCISLISVSFPACTSIGNYAFSGCTELTNVNFPACTSIGTSAFCNCSKLTNVNFPMCMSIGASAFDSCTSLTSISLPVCIRISHYAFISCTSLVSIYLDASTVCTLATSSAFANTGITSSTGFIFVPASLVASYKAATNWTYFSNRIFSNGQGGSSGGSD